MTNTNKLLSLIIVSVVLLGCSARNKAYNQTQKVYANKDAYKVENFIHSNDEVTLVLSFSGGGTRAAALSYGVLEGLRDTHININGKDVRLLDEVDIISSVSGGSFTAAYYGVHGESTFDSYKETFLYHDVTDDLTSIVLSPVHWFSKKTRTREAENYYQSHIFDDSTFSDIPKEEAPFIIINATDISTGTRFSFTQEYFDLICSDLNAYSVSSAVAASSAVPLIFSPVVLENRDDCVIHNEHSPIFDASNYRNRNAQASIAHYRDKEQTQYLHLADGGITDNLGLLAIYEIMEYLRQNESHRLMPRNQQGKIKPLVIISVDASTNPDIGIANSVEPPSIKQTVDAITDIQLHRYNDSTKDLMIEAMDEWASDASIHGEVATPYFIEISFNKTMSSDARFSLNQIRTDFKLVNKDVDLLIDEGNQQLTQDRVFQDFINAQTLVTHRTEHSDN
ncbi:patatin-like phospholipase family protein [Vibrio superstes]|nr:patatin-like phospholipase family protein [Vibrio superstes]